MLKPGEEIKNVSVKEKPLNGGGKHTRYEMSDGTFCNVYENTPQTVDQPSVVPAPIVKEVRAEEKKTNALKALKDLLNKQKKEQKKVKRKPNSK